MPRRKWVWDPEVNDLVEVSTEYVQPERVAPDIAPEFKEFRSPVDGTVISGRRALREHNKRNRVTNSSDFTETWKQAAKERERLYTGDPRFDQKRRKEALIRAYDTLSRKR